LDAALDAKLKALEPLLEAPDARPNWNILRVDVAKPVPPLWAEVYMNERAHPLPRLVLCTPEWTKGAPPLHSAAASVEALDALIMSPKRAEVLGHILQGTAVTWMIAETSDTAANAALRSLVEKESARLKQVLLIPPGMGKDGVNVLSALPVEISFATVSFRVDDPAEAMLVKLLNNGEPITEPTLYPVFGRGRVLAAIPTEKVNAALLEETGRFLCGACSCQVKAQNPGFDMLLNAHWQQIFGDAAPPPPDTAKPATKPQYVPIPKKTK
jgi:hypothetical protein